MEEDDKSNWPTNAVMWWDLTISAELFPDREVVIRKLESVGDLGAFQVEKGNETGYVHIQIRIRFKIKTRNPSKVLLPLKGHYSPTCKANQGNLEYVTKDNTRIAGPWFIGDSKVKGPPLGSGLPRQYQYAAEHPNALQQTIYDSLVATRENPGLVDNRIVNIVVDPSGHGTKTSAGFVAECLYGAIVLPAFNDYKDLLQATACILIDRQEISPCGVFLDLPRAIDQSRLNGIFSAIESIKDGRVIDCRHKLRQWKFNSPAVWVFSNTMPQQSHLSLDRWRIWNIIDGPTLVLVHGSKPCWLVEKAPVANAS